MLSKGVVVEEGTHEELMSLKSHYYNLVTTQVASADDEEEEFIQGDAGLSRRFSKQYSKQVSVLSAKSDTSVITDTYEPDKVIFVHFKNQPNAKI